MKVELIACNGEHHCDGCGDFYHVEVLKVTSGIAAHGSVKIHLCPDCLFELRKAIKE